jgi:hypothetical protein
LSALLASEIQGAEIGADFKTWFEPRQRLGDGRLNR